MEESARLSKDGLQSKVIDFLRFPLIIGIVLIHTTPFGFEGDISGLSERYSIFYSIYFLLKEVLAEVAVPMFFFISGFLFFYKKEFTLSVYRQKLKRRTHTLLVPYLIWNALFLILCFLVQKVSPGLNAAFHIRDFTFGDFLCSFWDTTIINPAVTGHNPILIPFWFMRDLIVMSLLAPVVHFLCRRCHVFYVLLLVLVFVSGFTPGITGRSMIAVCFFSFGAFFSIHGKNIVTCMKPYFRVSGVLYLLSAFLLVYCREYAWTDYISRVNVLLGFPVIVFLTSMFVGGGKVKNSRFLSRSSFFIFAYHGFIVNPLTRFLLKFHQPQSDMQYLFFYLLRPAIIIAVGLVIFWILKRYLPKTAALLTGDSYR